MTTRNLLSGRITLSTAESKASNVLHALRLPQQQLNFFAHIERKRHLLSHLVAHHLNTDPASVTISGQEYWYNGSFNLCIPVHVDNVAEPSLPEHVMFTHVDYLVLPWWSRWFRRARNFLLAALRLEQPSRLVPHRSAGLAELDVGYLLIQTITSGTALSELWDENYQDLRLQENLQRSIARVMLSLASITLPCIGTFRVDNHGYLRLDNRPLSVQSTEQENEGIPVNAHRRQVFTSVKDFVLRHIDDFSSRLLHQPNGISSQHDAYYQMAGLAGATALFPHLFRRELDNGPFVFALTDLHRSNILVDHKWNITCIIDLEFAGSRPIEFLQPPFWLGGGCIDEVTVSSFAVKHAEFVEHVKHIEQVELVKKDKLLPSATRSQEPLSAVMRQGWKLGTFWATLAIMRPVPFTEIFYDRILCDLMGLPQEGLGGEMHKFFATFWCKDSDNFIDGRKSIDNIIDKKLEDYKRYNEELHLFFADGTN
ncbi:hypothetical protein PWT90_08725 [Aphanocladium album]|nr:hypothetical protein PWT90_08725 [Aphanocladium album]